MLRAFDVVAIMAAEVENKSAETFMLTLLLADACCNNLRGRCFVFVLSSIFYAAMVLRSIEFISIELLFID